GGGDAEGEVERMQVARAWVVEAAQVARAVQHLAQLLAVPPLQRVAVVLLQVALPGLELGDVPRLDGDVGVAVTPVGCDAMAGDALAHQVDGLDGPVEHAPGVLAPHQGLDLRLVAAVAEDHLAAVAAARSEEHTSE